MKPKYPNAFCQLTGEDGNAFFIIGRARRALKKAGAPPADVEAFSTEAMSGDYDHVLQTVMAWMRTA